MRLPGKSIKSQCTAISRPIDAGQLLRQGAAGRPDQANVRNYPVVAADRVPESGRNTSVAQTTYSKHAKKNNTIPIICAIWFVV
ncbi:hypothetical protein BJI64_17690 [Acinetobacter baumannii]|nr:hypothetical protein BJI64_17690 [Acinetobacter baumannii]